MHLVGGFDRVVMDYTEVKVIRRRSRTFAEKS